MENLISAGCVLNSTSSLMTREEAAAGNFIHKRNSKRYPIPGSLNLLLVVSQMTAAFAILTAASRTHSRPLICALAVCFAFVMQMGFCLAHEAVHRKLHRNGTINIGAGVVAFTLFPGSFHFFEVAHLLHHRRNRSDDELEDYVLPEENPWFKRVMYYLLISGLFWLLLPVCSVAVGMVPKRRICLPRPHDESGAFRKFAQFLNGVRPNRVRRDLLAVIIVWATAFSFLHFRFASVAICYGIFAFSWASQQYIYHVRTPRHAVLGALDLKLWKPVELLYLHFNYHLTHHLAVWVPWIYMPSIAAHRPSRGYMRTYGNLWRPPELVAEAWPKTYQKSGPLPPNDERPPAFKVELPW